MGESGQWTCTTSNRPFAKTAPRPRASESPTVTLFSAPLYATETFRPTRTTPGSWLEPRCRDVTTVTSWPRARSSRAVASTCSVTPPTAG